MLALRIKLNVFQFLSDTKDVEETSCET